MPVLEYPEPMARFECNQKGCCCKKWGIPFQPADLIRLVDYLSEAEVGEVIHGARFIHDGKGTLTSFMLRRQPPDDRCQFLAEDQRCKLQVQWGAEAMPTLCRAFPAASLAAPDGRRTLWDARCPEVLEQLDESDEPIEIVRADLDESHPMAVRSRFRVSVPNLMLNDREMSADAFERIRGIVIKAFNVRPRTLTRTLAAVEWALWRASQGEPADEFALRDDPVEPFIDYLDTCVQAHGGLLLKNRLESYAHFIHAVDLSDVHWLALAPFLERRDDWRQVIDPDDPELSPLLFRYLALRAFAPYGVTYDSAEAQVVFGGLTHSIATAIRIAIGLVGWLELSDKRLALKVGLGASEFFYQSLSNTPAIIMPWFDPRPDSADRTRSH